MNAQENSAYISQVKKTKMIAVIDIGSNSVRLMVKDGSNKQKFLITTRLAEGKVNGALSKISMDRTANAVAVLFDKAIKMGAEEVLVFATAAVRNSVNGSDFTSLVFEKTGLKVDVVSGDLEANLAIRGALNGQDGGVIDIGGGSTEIAFSQGGEVVYSQSYPFGAVSLNGLFNGDKQSISTFLQNSLKGVRRAFNGKVYGVGGTITTLSLINLKINEYQAELVESKPLSVNELFAIKEELFSLTPSEIREKYPIASSRADIIAGGAEILYSVMACYGISEVWGSDGDNLEGYLEHVYEKE